MAESGSEAGSEPLLLALGSNLGDRLGHLRNGVRALVGDGLRVVRASSVYESEAQGVGEQPDFLNAVILAHTGLEPRQVLERALAEERAAGRVRAAPGEPRTLDVDLVFQGSRIVREPGLEVPHPRWRERAFVLAPLAEVAPDFRDPESGLTVLEVWRGRRGGLPPLEVVAPPSALLAGPAGEPALEPRASDPDRP